MDEPKVDPSLRDRREMDATGLGDCHRHDGLPGVAVLSIPRCLAIKTKASGGGWMNRRLIRHWGIGVKWLRPHWAIVIAMTDYPAPPCYPSSGLAIKTEASGGGWMNRRLIRH
ncbi:hypothetical protein [Pseudomonas sp. MS19]|uniref:hypothetical protein n=1 Tax=Pseudomonas sp. MS19 TaxID=2579939 RepID=UPI001562DEDD|nr:hypothetical protein [Pseudomonas sp. MS19]NRH26718.1 hypothetical protein [Pseudomonas sp. MS19]